MSQRTIEELVRTAKLCPDKELWLDTEDFAKLSAYVPETETFIDPEDGRVHFFTTWSVKFVVKGA